VLRFDTCALYDNQSTLDALASLLEPHAPVLPSLRTLVVDCTFSEDFIDSLEELVPPSTDIEVDA